ncbi:MAG: HmuY family protein [Bacteroidia bacterium]
MNNITKNLFLAALTAITISSCKKDETPAPEPVVTTLEQKTVSNLFANDSLGHYTFYSLRENTTVALSDSATTKWDIAFYSTKILINNGTSGPGSGGAAVVTQIFDEMISAPADSSIKTDNGTELAIPGGSGNGWYNYDPAAFIISPIAGRTIVVRTADGKFAKIEILSYYKNAPATPTMTDVSRYYTFRYKFQADGSKNLK